jgi:hypothetical protein
MAGALDFTGREVTVWCGHDPEGDDQHASWSSATVEVPTSHLRYREFSDGSWIVEDVRAAAVIGAYPTLGDAIAARFDAFMLEELDPEQPRRFRDGQFDLWDLRTVVPTHVELAGVSEDELAAALRAGRSASVCFWLGDLVVFDWGSIVTAVLACQGRGARLVEYAEVIEHRWDSSEGGGPMVRELGQALIRDRGVYYFVETGDADACMERVGRFASHGEALRAVEDRWWLDESDDDWDDEDDEDDLDDEDEDDDEDDDELNDSDSEFRKGPW